MTDLVSEYHIANFCTTCLICIAFLMLLSFEALWFEQKSKYGGDSKYL